MAFFYNTNPSDQELKTFKNLSEDPAFDAAILNMIINYNQ
jgi:hypothetical protein